MFCGFVVSGRLAASSSDMSLSIMPRVTTFIINYLHDCLVNVGFCAKIDSISDGEKEIGGGGDVNIWRIQ